MAASDAALAAERVLERGDELRAPEDAVVAAGAEPQAVGKAERAEEGGEATRVRRGAPVLGGRPVSWSPSANEYGPPGIP